MLSASCCPPPVPKMAVTVPSGLTDGPMFSMTPATRRKPLRAMSAARAATCWAALAGVVTITTSVLGSMRARPIWMSEVPGGMSMSR